ncbi:hypothetical protein EVAR_29542_1 [Eumeta japonica]|uniref:Uncharacterized protein n=1 Tax=Eumeta variegata TaxID=151549 RepID=A0A4C1WHT5_EUMVA|nr:hypothetical protein EVAR_29542_1 [Eumeta japonica]
MTQTRTINQVTDRHIRTGPRAAGDAPRRTPLGYLFTALQVFIFNDVCTFPVWAQACARPTSKSDYSTTNVPLIAYACLFGAAAGNRVSRAGPPAPAAFLPDALRASASLLSVRGRRRSPAIRQFFDDLHYLATFSSRATVYHS